MKRWMAALLAIFIMFTASCSIVDIRQDDDDESPRREEKIEKTDKSEKKNSEKSEDLDNEIEDNDNHEDNTKEESKENQELDVQENGEEHHDNQETFFPSIITSEPESEELTIPEGAEIVFRQTYWGMPEKDVIKTESGEIYTSGKVSGKDATYVAYESQVANLDCLVAYYFTGDDELFQVRLIMNEKHSNEDKYIDDYKTLESALTKKYGTPLIQREEWSDSSKKSYYAERKGDALCYGYLEYHTIFFLDDIETYIFMVMDADNYSISTIVDYYSTTFSAGEADFSGEL